MSRWFYVDMIKNGASSLIGGTTALEDTDLVLGQHVIYNEESVYVIFAHENLHDAGNTFDLIVQCQANVFGVNW